MLEIIVISQILGGVAGAIFLFWVSFHFYKMYLNKKLMNEITQQQSRVSVLKLMLRSRLRKNCNSLSKIFKGEVVLVEMFKEKYGNLASLDLGSVEHYQKIIVTLSEIATECDQFFEKKFKYAADKLALQNSEKKKTEPKDERLLEYEHVVQFELPCLVMIKEIISHQTSSRTLVERYNEQLESKRQLMKMPIELKIENQDLLFDLINRAYEKKKLEKASEIDPDFDPSTAKPATEDLSNPKSA